MKSIILTKRFIDCVYKISLEFNKTINAELIHSVRCINTTISCGVSIENDYLCFIFGKINSKSMKLDRNIYKLASENNILTLIVNKFQNRMYLLINNIVVPIAVNNTRHTKKQIRISRKRNQIVTVCNIRYLKKLPINNIAHFTYYNC
jgi:hypothetical protein